MRLQGLAYVQLGVAMVFSGEAQAALVCTPGDVLGPGLCEEVVSVGPIPATEFNNQALSFDRWQSNAQPGLDERLTAVTFSFGGTVAYDAVLKNFDLSTKGGGVVINEIFSFGNGSGPAGFLPTPVTTSGRSRFVFALSPGQAIPIQIDGTLADVSVAYTTGLDDYTGVRHVSGVGVRLNGLYVHVQSGPVCECRASDEGRFLWNCVAHGDDDLRFRHDSVSDS